MICIKEAKELSSKLAKACTTSKDDMHKVDSMLSAIWYANHSINTTLHPMDIEYPYNVYDHPQYINNLDVCFKYYTRLNLLTSLKFFNALNIAPKTIIDLYGGDGRASALLATAFPNSIVYYHQTAEAQIKLALDLFAALGLCNIVHVKKPIAVEAIFAFECFEHFIAPHYFFDDVIFNAKYLVDSSSFSIEAPGHFYRYIDSDGKIRSNRHIKKNFYAYLRSKNMYAVHRKEHFVYKNFFNCTPVIHMRHSA